MKIKVDKVSPAYADLRKFEGNTVTTELPDLSCSCPNAKCKSSEWSDNQLLFIVRTSKNDVRVCPECNEILVSNVPNEILTFLVDNFSPLQN